MKNPQVIAKLQKELLENAALLKQGKLLVSDRVNLDISEMKSTQVKALNVSGNGEKSVRCKYYNEMPYHPLPNACVYKITKGSFH